MNSVSSCPLNVVLPFSSVWDRPSGGGIETFVRSLCSIASEVGLELFIPGVGRHESQEASVHFYPVIEIAESEYEYVRALRQCVRSGKLRAPPGAVVLANAEHYCWALQKLRLPTVLMAHGVISETLRIRRGRLYARLFDTFVESQAVRRSERVACVTERVREYYTRRYRGEPAEKFVSITMGVDLTSFEGRPRRPALRELGVDVTGPIILFVGRLSPEKNIPLFLAACDRLAASGVDFTAVLVGDGAERNRLKEMLAGRPWVKWVPKASHDQVLDLMAMANALAITSTYEGLPIVLLEALGSGLPVISTDVGRARELLRGGMGMIADAEPAAFGAALRGWLSARPTRHRSMDPRISARIDFRTTARAIAAVLRRVAEEASATRTATARLAR